MKQTLSNYLTRDNPKVIFDKAKAEEKLKKSGGKGSTRNDEYPKVKTIRKWEEFSRKNLERCFDGELGRALRRKHRNLQSFSRIPEGFRRINSESSLRVLLTLYHHSVVLHALKKTSRRMLRQEVEMITGEDARLVYDKTNKFKPDFAGIKRVDESQREIEPDNILPGDAKPSWVWTSKSLKESLSDSQSVLGQNRGLSQVVKYCINASVRYGYILTDKELFILRVRPDDGTDEEPTDDEELREITYDNPAIDYVIVPWSRRGDRSSTLTISLALWALHLLAANDGCLKFKYFKALKDETLRDPRGQSTPSETESASDNSSFEQTEDDLEIELPNCSSDDDEDEDGNETAEDEERQDVSVISPNISFQQPRRNELPRLAKRKREVTEEVEGNIVVSSRRDRLRSRPTATM